MMRITLFAAAVVLVALFLTGNLGGGPLGPPTTTSIADLFADPGRWDGKQVSVTGQVSDRVALLGYGGLRLRDQTGAEIIVIGAQTPAAIGQTTTISGKFVTAFAAGNITVPVIVDD